MKVVIKEIEKNIYSGITILTDDSCNDSYKYIIY